LSPDWVIMMTQVTVKGLNNTIGGVGSKGVTAVLDYADTNTLSNTLPADPHDLTINIASQHGMAWMEYFNRTFNSSGMQQNSDYTMSYQKVTTSNPLNDFYKVTIIVHNVGTLDHTRATVTLSIGELGII
jgi:hypothetical protein